MFGIKRLLRWIRGSGVLKRVYRNVECFPEFPPYTTSVAATRKYQRICH